jgi:hypothetical protein
MVTSMDLRLFSAAPRLGEHDLAALLGHGDADLAAKILRGGRVAMTKHFIDRPGGDDLPAV